MEGALADFPGGCCPDLTDKERDAVRAAIKRLGRGVDRRRTDLAKRIVLAWRVSARVLSLGLDGKDGGWGPYGHDRLTVEIRYHTVYRIP